MEFVTFFDDVPDGLPITQAVVDRVRAEAIGGTLGLDALRIGITGMLSGLMALEAEVIALRKLVEPD